MFTIKHCCCVKATWLQSWSFPGVSSCWLIRFLCISRSLDAEEGHRHSSSRILKCLPLFVLTFNRRPMKHDVSGNKLWQTIIQQVFLPAQTAYFLNSMFISSIIYKKKKRFCKFPASFCQRVAPKWVWDLNIFSWIDFCLETSIDQLHSEVSLGIRSGIDFPPNGTRSFVFSLTRLSVSLQTHSSAWRCVLSLQTLQKHDH